MPDTLEIINDKSLIFRKYILYVDVVIKDGEIVLGQKLNSFFGQIGVFENTEDILEFVSDYFKSIFLKSLHFKNIDYKEEKVVSTINFLVYLPLTLIFYFGEKKIDFYVYSSWNKNFFLKNLKSVFLKNYNIYSKYERSILCKFDYYFKLLEYSKIIKRLFTYNYKSNNILLFNKNLINFFVDEDRHTLYFEEYFNYLFKKKKRLFTIKKLRIKNKSLLIKLNKKILNVNLSFVFYFILMKVSFFDNFFDEHNFFDELMSFYSKIYSFKNNLMKRFRRRKKFKKLFIKNLMGKKFTFYKIFNSIEEKKKKKR